jgi:hypothetical protein
MIRIWREESEADARPPMAGETATNLFLTRSQARYCRHTGVFEIIAARDPVGSWSEAMDVTKQF